MTIKLKPDAGAVFAASGPEREAAIERIVKATGTEQPVDRELLAAAIYLAVCDFAEMADVAELDSEANRRRFMQFRKGLEDCIDQAKRHPFLERAAAELSDTLKSLRAIEEWQNARRQAGEGPRSTRQRQPSRIEWLAGLWLPLIYQRCFGLRATWSRKGDEPSGHVIDFIAAVLKELKLECSPETIGTAMTRLKRLRAAFTKHGIYTSAQADKKFTKPVTR